MAIFDQRGQQVNYQYNAAGNINFDTVENRVELAQELEKLKVELSRAREAGEINDELAADADYEINRAALEAKKPSPDKKSVVERINRARTLVESVSAMGGLASALTRAAEVAQALF